MIVWAIIVGWVGGFVNCIWGGFSLFDRVWVGWTTFESIDGFGVGSSSVVGCGFGWLVMRVIATIFNYSFTLLRTEWWVWWIQLAGGVVVRPLHPCRQHSITLRRIICVAASHKITHTIIAEEEVYGGEDGNLGVFWIRQALWRDDALPSYVMWAYWFCYSCVGYDWRKCKGGKTYLAYKLTYRNGILPDPNRLLVFP